MCIAECVLCQRIQAVIEKPRPFVRTTSFFGPDRRRRSSLDYEGQERRMEPATPNSSTTDEVSALLAKL